MTFSFLFFTDDKSHFALFIFCKICSFFFIFSSFFTSLISSLSNFINGKLVSLKLILKSLPIKETFKSASIYSVFSKFNPGLRSQFFISSRAELNSFSEKPSLRANFFIS